MEKKKPGCLERILAFFITIALFIFGFHYLLKSCAKMDFETAEKTEKPAEAETAKKEEAKPKDNGMDKIDVWCLVQEHVERKLVSPKSASFPFGGAQKHVECTAPGIFIVRSYVDAKNAFGAEIRQNFFAKVVKYENGKFEVIQLTFENPF